MTERRSTLLNVSLEDSEDLLHSRQGFESRLDSILCYATLALLLAAVLGLGAVESWGVLGFEIGAALLFVGWVAKQCVRGEVFLRGWKLYVPAVLWLLIGVAQLIFHTTAYAYATSSSLRLYTAYAAVLLVVVECLTAKLRRRAMVALVGFGAVYALFAIVQNLTAPGTIYWRIKPALQSACYGSYVNRNHYAGLMEMLVPFALVLAASDLVRGGARVLTGFAFILMASSIFLSASRGGMTGLAIELVLFCALSFSSVHRFDRRILSSCAIVVLAIAAFLAYTSQGQVEARFSDLSSEHRVDITRDTLRLWMERPIMGWGYGTFVSVYPHVRSYYSDKQVNAAHDDYAQILAESGILGFASFIAFLGIVLYKGNQRRHGWRSSWSRASSLAALLGCTGMLVHSFVDFNLQIPANAAVFVLLCGFCLHSSDLKH